jgi:hypothetical protein
MRTVAKINEGLFAGVSLKEDAAPPTPVAAIRAALGNKFFPQKTDAAVAPIACFDEKFYFINKRHCLIPQQKNPTPRMDAGLQRFPDSSQVT